MTDRLGKTVFFETDPRQNNSLRVAPALVTNVLDTEDKEERVNLLVSFDTGEQRRVSNVLLLSSRPKDVRKYPEGPLAFSSNPKD